MKSVYLIGSLRNPEVPKLANQLRKDTDMEIFSDWFCAGPIADDSWQEHEQGRRLTMSQALKSYAAKHVFAFDKYHLDRCDGAILQMPAGKSGHLELGYMAGKGKKTCVFLTGEPERWDCMYQFADEVVYSYKDLTEWLLKQNEQPVRKDYQSGVTSVDASVKSFTKFLTPTQTAVLRMSATGV